MRFLSFLFLIGLSFSYPLFAKGPPPGTGVGDVKANIMIMLDDSGSMSATDYASGLYRYTYGLAVANNGDIFAADYMKDRVTHLDSSFAVQAYVGGYNYYNNDSNKKVKFRDLYDVAVDQNDPSDEFFWAVNRTKQYGRNGFGNSYIVKVCTGITITAICPEFGRIVATKDTRTALGSVDVQGNYVYAIGSAELLFKFNKSNLSEVKRRNIRNSIRTFDISRSDVVAIGGHVIVSDYYSRNKRACKFNAHNLSNATFGNGQHCLSIGAVPWAMAAAGKATASTADDYLYFWVNNRNATIKKYEAISGNHVGNYIRRGTSPGRTQSSYAMDVDSSGNIYVAERGSSRRQYISKFNDSVTYVARGPAGGVSMNRMQISHAAITAILQDPDLTAGANFGIMSWGSRFNIRTPVSTRGANDIISRTLRQIRPNGGTQLGRALQHVRTRFWHNNSVTPIDIGARCQGNYNVIISDGQYWGSPTPEREMPLLSHNATRPVKSFIVGLGNSISGNRSFINLAQSRYGDTTPPGALFANNVQQLTRDLRSAILSAINGNLSFTSPKIDFSSSPNGYICQPSFKYKEDDQWQGLLTRYSLVTTGANKGAIDDPRGLDPTKTIRFHDLLDARPASAGSVHGRKIWTVDHDIENPLTGQYLNNNFFPNYITTLGLNLVEASTQALMLEGETNLGTRDVARIMNFMRGHDMYDQDNDCSGIPAVEINNSCLYEDKGGADAPLLYKMHDLYNSTPAYVGYPQAVASSEVAGTESEYRYLNNYKAFQTNNKNRKNIVLVGSNGGMLHAFDNGCTSSNANCTRPSNPGKELWAFVPPAIVQNLQHIVRTVNTTELRVDLLSTDQTIHVANASTFPSSGVLRIDDEFIQYRQKISNGGSELFTGLTRGYNCFGNQPFCSDATAHLRDTRVYDETTLRTPEYSVFAVDGPIVAKDIFTNGTWKTVALVSFGKGGRGFTALDVTNPDLPTHMFTILNDIKGPGLGRSIKVWQTTLNSATNNLNTILTKYDYSVGINSTALSGNVNQTELTTLPVVDASSFSSSGYITVTNDDGNEENIYYDSKSGNNLLTLIRAQDANGNSTALNLVSGSSVTQDASCSVNMSAIPPEYDYTRLALTTSMPHIINIKINGVKKWVAVFGGGQNYGKDCTTGNVVYVMDLEDNPGTIIKQIEIPDDPSNAIYNSVNSTLALVQRDGTIKANYYGALVYFADLENKLWKIDLTDNAIGSNLGRKIKLFEDVATDTNGRRNYQEIVPVLDSSVDVPIAVGQLESNILRLYYGTGDMDNLADRSSQILNRLYGISDMTFTNFALPWQSADDTRNVQARYRITDCTNSTSLAATCPVLSNINQKNIGWYIDLPLSRKTTGRKVLYDKEQVYFVYYQPTTQPCSPGDAILGSYNYMCPSYKRLVVALGAGLGTGATTQGSQVYVGVSNAGAQGQYARGQILEITGSSEFQTIANQTASQIQGNTKGSDSIIVLSPVGSTSTEDSSIDAWRHYSGENYYDN